MKKILIADDEECLLLAYKKLLSGPGVDVDTTQSMLEAHNLLKKNHYAAIIVDLRLTNSSEMEGLAIITDSHKLYPECKIIVLTAYGDCQIKENVINAGATFFLEKPISTEVLRDYLKKIGLYS